MEEKEDYLMPLKLPSRPVIENREKLTPVRLLSNVFKIKIGDVDYNNRDYIYSLEVYNE